jgi:hypothetical protein
LEVMTREVIDPAREARVIAAVGSSAIRSGCAWAREMNSRFATPPAG